MGCLLGLVACTKGPCEASSVPTVYWRALPGLQKSLVYNEEPWEASRVHHEAPRVPESAVGGRGVSAGDTRVHWWPWEASRDPRRLLGGIRAHCRAL